MSSAIITSQEIRGNVMVLLLVRLIGQFLSAAQDYLPLLMITNRYFYILYMKTVIAFLPMSGKIPISDNRKVYYHTSLYFYTFIAGNFSSPIYNIITRIKFWNIPVPKKCY